MKEYLNLLLAFQALPRLRRRSTFMEISGYPHYENVCSNILKFYLDPQCEHGLRDLLLKAFLRMTGRSHLVVPDTVVISREYTTEECKRIDLVVDCEAFVLGVENKIYHWEANDFDIYERALAALGQGKEVIKVVLCLNIPPSDPLPKGGFERHTYRELWVHVRDMLGHHLSGADPKWTLYLNEFMETTSRLGGETLEGKEVVTFFVQHQDVIERLVADRQRILNRMADSIQRLMVNIRTLSEPSPYLERRWIYQTYTLASHYKISGAAIGLNLDATARGWLITLFQLKGNAEVLQKLKSSPELRTLCPESVFEHERYVLRRWDLHADEIELQEALINCYRAVIAAADTLPSAQSTS